jgi:hypothetical protein
MAPKKKKKKFVLPSRAECQTLTSRPAFAKASTSQFRTRVLIEDADTTGSIIRARVKGKLVYDVKLTLGPYGSNAAATCSCTWCKKALLVPGAYRFCKHVTGVVLYLLGTPEEERDIFVAECVLEQRYAYRLEDGIVGDVISGR